MKYTVYKGKVIELELGADGLFRYYGDSDTEGTIFAIRDPKLSVDNGDACGIGIFTLPDNFLGLSLVDINDACRAHDYKYTSPAYQLFHSRIEADRDLKRDVMRTKYGSLLGPIFYQAVRLVGGKWWDNKETN